MKKTILFILFLIAFPVFAKPISKPVAKQKSAVLSGIASFYADRFHGRATASGALYDRNKMTAAHLTLPFGTLVEVKNITNGRKLNVLINDRGPFAKSRVLDVSSIAAKKLGFYRKGVTKVTFRILKK